jgi:phospholipid/cholesterol/gamma-HCH transport system substrate-binding protein
MQTRAPSAIQVLVAVGFALSCFGLWLFLWTAFGGPTPLKPEGYRVQVPFGEATQLAVESDVRISGVSVGRVKEIELSDDGVAVATLEIDAPFAPIPADTRAILRQKTLLGETYVELTPGSPGEPGAAPGLEAQAAATDADAGPPEYVPEGGSLGAAQVSEAVQLDEIFRAFDEPTRLAFRQWMEEAAVALRGRGADLNAALGNLAPFSAEGSRLVGVLDSQRQATGVFIRNAGEVFEALSERQGQLQSLVRSADAVFATTAARDRELKEAFIALPTFLDESRLTLARLERFAVDTDPLFRQLLPAARELSPTLVDLGRLAPELDRFFQNLRPAIGAAKRGLPALRDVLDDQLPPLLTELDPFMRQFIPISEALHDYRHEVTAFLGNAAAATNGFNRPVEAGERIVRYLRLISPLGPEALAAYPNRLTTSRANPYVAPLGYQNLAATLEGFETRQCSAGVTAKLDPDTPNDPDFYQRFPGATNADQIAQATSFFERLREFAFAGRLSSADIPAPPCKGQAPEQSIGGLFSQLTEYLHIDPLP